ncbi:MAG TPA: aspartate--tRNA ligase, partial [Candidatus Kapabacteria bacterium]|nr:aspartate--tRNA ligase [Candidatus Kapabacteria bacterium]
MSFERRTIMAGELRKEHEGQRVVLNGWVDGVRDMGGVLFFDVRDRSGKAQCIARPSSHRTDLSDPTDSADRSNETARKLRNEFVVAVGGLVQQRENPNSKLPTGEVEIEISYLEILNSSEVPPFEVKEDTNANEDLRLKYRYLDLRRPSLQANIAMRHKIVKSIRDYFDERGFYEIETPIMMKATPEGARDFLVPSRLHPGSFYALPQSPQLYKQVLMIAGFDRYFQIARCFRDEDLRADRQPEFTQLDVEMSFPNEEIVYEVMESCLARVWADVGLTLPSPFAQLSYHEAMSRFGTDKPDLRYGLEIQTLTEILRGKTEFKVFNDVLEKRLGVIGAVVAPGAAAWSRKQLDTLTDLAKVYGAGGLVWIKVTAEGFDSSAKKFLTDDVLKDIRSVCCAREGDLILIISHPKWERAYTILGALRIELAKRLELLKGKEFEFAPAWITNFPMFEEDEETHSFTFKHHPFTSPDPRDWQHRAEGLQNVRARAYDIVINGYELGSGSIRIHDRKMQEEVFDLLGHTKEQQIEKFGFILEAFQYGAPP